MKNTFGITIIPENDQRRIDALSRYKIFNTPPEHAFDNVARLATQIFNVPISLISLVDAEKVFFKANIGMGKTKVVSRGSSVCSLAILKPEVTVFENASTEPCLLSNPNVAGEFGMKFYAGAPLITHDGFHIGTICVIDKIPRKFSANDEVILKSLAMIVMDEIELRLSSIEEISKQRETNEELSAINEEIWEANEELSTTIKELATSKDHLSETFVKLWASEHQLKIIFDQAPSAIALLTGPELIINAANPLILHLWGKDRRILNQPLLQALPELEGKPLLKILDDVYTSGKPCYQNELKVALEHQGIWKDSFFNFAYQPVKDSSGLTKSILVVATDVTEQVYARKAVNESNERLALALDAGKLGSYDLNLLTGIMYGSEQYKKNFGLDKDAVFNLAELFNAILPEYREYVQKQINKVIQNDGVYQAEYEILWPDGSRHWIMAFGKPRHDNEGKVERMIGVTQNITERKEFEKRKDDFLGVISHELKTPITSLKANLQLLERIKNQSSNPLIPILIDSSTKSMNKINSMVDDLLNIHRFGEGKLDLHKTNFVISEMLNLCCNHVRLAGKHKLIIQGDEELEVYADEHRIDQVVVNFVNNAVKYAPDSTDILINISKQGDFARIEVQDFGSGIPENQLPHLFDRYWRADHSGTKYSGLGLGLYICAEIIKQHNGQIDVVSELGKGSTFWFTIPLIDS